MTLSVMIRSLVRDWRFSLFVVVILGAAIALCAALFTIADGILFDPLAVSEPSRLGRLFVKAPWGGEWSSVSYPEVRTMRERSRGFSDVAAFASDIDVDAAIAEGEPFAAKAALATGNFFRTLGVNAARGRVFGESDERASNAVAVISDDFARRSFASASNALGATIRINNAPHTIIGIAPPRFHGVAIDAPTDIWMPVTSWPVVMPNMEALLENADFAWISVVARLRSGVELSAANAEIRALFGKDAKLHRAIESAYDEERRPQLTRLTMLTGSFVALILTIAFVNAGSLQLVRGERRQRELAIRAAIGASRGELLRQLAIEGALLALAAGAFGLLLAHLLVRGLVQWTADSFPLLLHVARPVLDIRAMAILFVLMALGAVACGLIPALRVTRIDLQHSLRGTRTIGRAATIRGALVVVQIALSVIVLIGAGLMIRSLRNMQNVSLGFATEQIVTARVDLSRQGYKPARAAQTFERLHERLTETPGVNAVAIGRTMPIDSGGMLVSISLGEDERVSMNAVAPGFFSALGVPLLRGREISTLDTKESEPIAIVNDLFARRFWPNEDPIGKRFSAANKELRVVGVVRSTRYHDLREAPFPILFRPLAQSPSTSAEIAIRTSSGNGAAILRDTIRSLDRNVPIHDLQPLRDRAGVAWRREAAIASMLTFLGALALLLAAVGLFSVISYRTETRRKEIGVRIAVGASAHDVVQLVLRQTSTLVAAGISAGLAGAWFTSRLAASFLFGVSPFDATTFASVSLVFILAAAALPALRAMRMDAAEMLRAE